MRRHHVWILIALALTLVAWLSWNALLVESDLTR
jgi:hypothetical protein